MGLLRNLMQGMLLFTIVLGAGTYLISYTEETSTFVSFYHIFMSITTVGGTIDPLTFNGQIVTVAAIFLGMGSVLYIATLGVRAFVEGQTMMLFTGLRGGIKSMKRTKNHHIVCGYGQLGMYVCQTLKQAQKKYIIIERDQEKATYLLEHGEQILQGDALDTKTLLKANIEHAKSIIGTLSTDADNIYLMMTASELNPTITLAAEAREETAVKRLHKIGAQIVVLPQVVGGRQLANAVLELEKSEKLSTISKA